MALRPGTRPVESWGMRADWTVVSHCTLPATPRRRGHIAHDDHTNLNTPLEAHTAVRTQSSSVICGPAASGGGISDPVSASWASVGPLGGAAFSTAVVDARSLGFRLVASEM